MTPILRPKNRWPLLRIFLNLFFFIVTYSLHFLEKAPLVGVGLLMLALAQLILYFFRVRPDILKAQEIQPEVELAVTALPILKTLRGRIARGCVCLSPLLIFLGMGLLKPVSGAPWLVWTYNLVLVAWGVSAFFQTLAEVRDFRWELRALELLEREPQAQHYGPSARSWVQSGHATNDADPDSPAL